MSTKDRFLEIRISSSGSIKTYVSKALEHFEEKGMIPIVFHTLPPSDDKDAEKQRIGGTDKLPKSLTNVPKLLTVVEVVKREFMKQLAEQKSARLKGLHQYNEVGTLEDLSNTHDTEAMDIDGAEKSAEARAQEEVARSKKIVDMLSGTNHVKVFQTPFMRVTLSMHELPELEASGATFQPARTRKLAKSAKTRARKRAAKANAAEAGAK